VEIFLNFFREREGKIGKICSNVGNELRNVLGPFKIPKANLGDV
jgi:hypothetical protein